ncbi:cytochrome c biogenesis protein [Bdellovibrio sp. HCB337]|uniref:cytochrome c biogenesis protein n=1 Tax=Bdellovibrio sp. HCB337 TaxID=3394358 RepID=UPI0039A5965B
MKRLQVILLLILSLLVFKGAYAAAPGSALGSLPVQSDGRVKPYDTFAKEMLEIVYGKKSFEGRGAAEIIFTWMLSPSAWKDKKIFEVRNHEVLKALKLSQEQRYFTGDELFDNDNFQLLMQELQAKRDSKEKLTPYFQALQRLEHQMVVFREIATGHMMRLIPPKEGTAWLSVVDFQGDQQVAFANLAKAFVEHIGAVAQNTPADQLEKAAQALDESVLKFQEVAKSNNPALYDHDTRIKVEVHYNKFHPFRWAYVLYMLAAIFCLLVWTMNKPGLMKAAWVFAAIGFVLHTYGFCVRMYLMDRAPVTNMYETVVWVSWGALVFSAILEIIYKFRVIFLAGTLGAMVALIVADTAPAVLDPSLQPLEAVLRSNYWLTVHVMTITISYAAFLLAFVLGDIGLIYYIRGEEKHQAKIQAIATSVYRAMQIGVAFLAPGIILGGIWADYSWGRFWGWDPKETWALIALLGYLAVLHGRLGGWFRNFGMIASGVITFSLVIMAWYGVNFVLGAGLHSYGFGAGGVEYVSAFVVAHFLLVLYAGLVRKK